MSGDGDGRLAVKNLTAGFNGLNYTLVHFYSPWCVARIIDSQSCELLRGFIFPSRCSLNINRDKGGIVVTKTFAKLIIGITALAVTTWFGTSSSRAYGDAPWCAVINIGTGTVYWDCQYRTFEACYHLGNILAGNRGFCNLNPWPGPSQVVPYKHRKRHTQY